MRAITKTLSLISSTVFQVSRSQLRNFAGALTQQQVTIPNQETLTGRILLYLNPEKDQQLDIPKYTSETLKTVLQNQNQMHKLRTNELLIFANNLTNHNLTRNELLLVLKELDTECCVRLSDLSSTDILRLLNIYMSIIPHRMTDFKFYKYSIKILFDSLSSLNKKDLLQLMFYIGLKKKNLETQTMLRQCIRSMDHKFIENLSCEELCIICNATFKTSTKIINKNLLEKVRSYISNNLAVLDDPALFVTLLKTLRHNRYQNDDLLNTISYAMFFNKTFTFYSFTMICHIMALFADYFFYDEKLFKFLTNKCLEQLSESSFISKEIHPTEQLRAKDIKRFLWIMSMFSEMKLINHGDIKNVIMPKIMERIRVGELVGDVDSLVDITLYLWILNYHANELVPYIFNNNKWHLLTANPKTNLRLNLLLHAIHSENPDLWKTLRRKPVENPNNFSTYQLHKRPLMQRLLNNLQGIRSKLDLSKFELSQDIPYLNIVGITGYKNELSKAVHVEVLDDYTRIKNIEEDVPVGLMALKLRLLDRSEEGVLVVSQKEMEEMTDADLNEYLLDEIKLIC
ncbi:hypothetical protein Zmor_020809 [Zophobas morio]|uniref:Uncharacterized protein n=1 Tax=Zophobas morio TaxID=2755281 RepID=A0AA38I788_9CUCU|nr:hypothetical protein Zmor_020809 [Zophobas morio]